MASETSGPVVPERAKGSGYEPRFDLDLSYGLAGERFVDALLRGDKVEVKRDDKWTVTGKLYVEYAHRPYGKWEWSGLSTTQATHWAFVLGQTEVVLLIPTATLKKVCHELKYNSSNRREETHGSCPTRGIVVPTATLFGWLRDRI